MVLVNLGEVARDQGAHARAVALCEESLALFRGLGEKRGMAYALTYLGSVARSGGAYERALALYGECLALYRHVGEQSGIATSLEGLAEAVCALGAAAHAAALLGAAAALRERIGAPLPPADYRDYERTVAAVRAALGDDYHRAWDAAQVRPLAQVLAEALPLGGGTAPALADRQDASGGAWPVASGEW
jgi:tetratricopeptide (TPR) repeat protein